MPFYSSPYLYGGSVYGLYFVHVDSRMLFLPLESVQAAVTVNDVCARVTLTQEYHHDDSAFPTLDAKYSFPLPAKASVSSFAMIKEDGTRVIGVVQEKQEAKKTYEKAVEDGKLASLMEEDHPDVFTVTVGNILHGEKVKIELSYMTELAEDEDNDSIRFSLPTYISQRYGTDPSQTSSLQSSANSRAYFTLAANIETATPISKISSPSHVVETELGPDSSLPNAKDLPFSNFARVSLTSPTYLTKDFVLTVRSAGLDAPRCLAEVHPAEEHNSIALALTLVPRFKIPDLPSQEFVFLVDRSGSMDGWGGTSRIETAKKALIVMLRSLPHKDSLFNIVSFGDRSSSLWKSSVAYNQKTLEEATAHVDRMKADMGGTEIRSALESTFKNRKTDRPTSLFVLTDGDAWDLDATLESVKTAVKKASKDCYLRVFTLGIGGSASTAMVDGIARVGNGSAVFVNDTESFTGKTARLLKAAKAPLIRNIRVSWGVDSAPGTSSSKAKEYTKDASEEKDDGFELLSNTETEATLATPQKISLFDSEDKEPLTTTTAAPGPPPPAPITLPPSPPLQQSPVTIRALSPATRLYVYAIISSPSWKKGDPIPKSVTLKGTLDSGADVELEIPVTLSHLTTNSNFPPPLHSLAAKKLVQDFLDGQHSLSPSLDSDTMQRTVEANVVRIGKAYSIASKYTSFVCVDESEAKRARSSTHFVTPVLERGERLDSIAAKSLSLGSSSGVFYKSAKKSKGVSLGGALVGSVGSLFSSKSRSSPPSVSSPAYRSAPVPPAGGGGMMRMAQAPQSISQPVMAASAPRSFSSRLLGSSPAPQAPPPPPAPLSRAPPSTSYSYDPTIEDCISSASIDESDVAILQSLSTSALLDEEVDSSRGQYEYRKGETKQKEIVPLSDADKLDAIVRQQSFDGSFAPTVLKACQVTSTIESLVAAIPEEVKNVLDKKVLESLVATLVAMISLKKLEKEKEAWEGVYEKALDYCTEKLEEVGVLKKVGVEQLEESVGQVLA